MKNQKRKKRRRRNKKQEGMEIKGNHIQEGKPRERKKEIKKVVKISKMSKQIKLLSVNVKGLNSSQKEEKYSPNFSKPRCILYSFRRPTLEKKIKKC